MYARHVANLGFPVFDADKEVHDMYSAGGEAVEVVRELAPDAIKDNAVCRQSLASKILVNPNLLKDLETSIHPLVTKRRKFFFDKCNNEGYLCAIYDIPLLFEKNYENDFDYVLVVTADAETQQRRVLSRQGRHA